jgi:hypothetical protein
MTSDDEETMKTIYQEEDYYEQVAMSDGCIQSTLPGKTACASRRA